MTKYMRVYEIEDRAGATCSFEPTKKAAEEAVKLYGDGYSYVERKVPLTRQAFCEFLTAYAGGAG